MLNHRMRQATLAGPLSRCCMPMTQVTPSCINMLRCHRRSGVIHPGHIRVALGRKKAPKALEKALQGVEATEAAKELVTVMQAAKAPVIVLGLEAYHHPQYGMLRFLAEQLAALVGGQVAVVTDGANAAGMWLAGVVPHRGPFATAVASEGRPSATDFQEAMKGYWLHQFSPTQDTAQPVATMRALSQAEFVVACAVLMMPSCGMRDSCHQLRRRPSVPGRMSMQRDVATHAGCCVAVAMPSRLGKRIVCWVTTGMSRR